MITIKRFVAVVAFAVSTVGLAGCLKATGGGKLTGSHFGGTITTGFQLQCEDVAGFGHVTGQFQYHDHGTDHAFHAVIDTYPLQVLGQSVPCEALDSLLAGYGLQGNFQAVGSYTPFPLSLGAGGQVQITIADQNDSGVFVCGTTGVDALAVQIIDGPFTGYAEQGCLDKGNFTVFTE